MTTVLKVPKNPVAGFPKWRINGINVSVILEMPLEVERIDVQTSFLFHNVRISLLFMNICTGSKFALVEHLV